MKGVRCPPGVHELTWDGNGRSAWQYGREKRRDVLTEPVSTFSQLRGLAC